MQSPCSVWIMVQENFLDKPFANRTRLQAYYYYYYYDDDDD